MPSAPYSHAAYLYARSSENKPSILSSLHRAKMAPQDATSDSHSPDFDSRIDDGPMGIKYSVQAISQSQEGQLKLHVKYYKWLRICCPDFAVESVQITPRMREIVLANWDNISAGKTPGMVLHVNDASSPVVYFYDRFYGTLFKQSPEVKPLFRSSIIVQGKALISIVQTIANTTNCNNAIEKIVDLAYRHNKYGIKMGYYNALGIILLDALKECTGEPMWDAELATAWHSVYSFMMIAMAPILYHGTTEPTEKEKEMAKVGKFHHTMTIRRPVEVQPTGSAFTSVNPGACPVVGANTGQCPVPH
ncbi:Aste57867_57 [Aphanomyces stellatus]|uniref:Aste57867_57 protein n=1 Tax=Aphanomyces stellatus TaxID=120398 RepID=A0A485K6M4_9STRA|nr:hypothetical protein As57867_000057 [Aphanomyces stellatus]VFT77283.1 Aste57867_57 [Aphanomyces stellatus]